MEQKVSSSGAPETMLGTLYLRAKASRLANPVLVDRHAEAAVERLDYDFGRLGVANWDPNSVAIRAVSIDRRVRDLIAARPEVTVLHLGCGLDTRVYRIDPPPSVEWYDVDLPEVISLHRRLFGQQRSHHHTVPASVTDPNLLERIPDDKPVLVVAEGLTMYLNEQDGLRLLRRVVHHFPAGDLLFDAFSPLNIRLSNRLNPIVTRSGSSLRWGIDDPHQLERTVRGLALVEEWSYTAAPELTRYSMPTRAALKVLDTFRTTRRLGRLLHYRF